MRPDVDFSSEAFFCDPAPEIAIDGSGWNPIAAHGSWFRA